MDVIGQKSDENQVIPKPGKLLGIRHVQYFLMFSGAVIVYGMRTVLIVGIVAMIDPDDTNKNYPTYPEWKNYKNVILSSFSWGHIWFQIIAGQVAKNYGPKYFLTVAISSSALCILLIPWFGAEFGYKGIIALRAIEGALHGVLFPSVHFLLSKWSHISERAEWGSFVYAEDMVGINYGLSCTGWHRRLPGSLFVKDNISIAWPISLGQVLGNCLAMPITGVISASNGGWPIAFYFYGFLGMTWSVLWCLFGSNTPSADKRISPEERAWIESGTVVEKIKKPPTPWKSIFTSVPFIAIIITHCGQNWGFWTLLSEIPSFMKEILGFKIAQNSYLSALPYFVMWLMNLVFSPIADIIIAKGLTTVAVSRKIFNSIGLFIPALALISLSFIESDNKTVIIVVLVIAVGFNAGHYCGFNINHMDISPTFSGTLMGITNSISAIFTIMAPLAVDAVKSVTGYGEGDKQLWNIIFCVSAGFYIVAGCVFIIFGSSDIQPWNSSGNKDKKNVTVITPENITL